MCRMPEKDEDSAGNSSTKIVNLRRLKYQLGRLAPQDEGGESPRRSGHGLSTIRLLLRVIDGKALVGPWVTDGGTWPQDFGHVLLSLPVEAGPLRSPAQCAHPQVLQPGAERTDEPARPWDGKVVEPALADPPKSRTDFPDVVVPALAEYLIDAPQSPVDPFPNRAALTHPTSWHGSPPPAPLTS